MIRLLTIVLFISFLELQAQSQGELKFTDLRQTSMSELLSLSSQQNKPVFVYFTSEGCGPCKKMEKEVFSDSNVINHMQSNFILAKSKIIFKNSDTGGMKAKDYKEANKDLLKVNKKYKVEFYPTFIILLDSDEKSRAKGFMTKEEFLDFLST